MNILIVDDKEENLYLLESLLKGSGYKVTSAKNGVEALEKVKRDSIDMIISDILMPKMDGFQLCRECKRDDTLRKIPFIFYTATYTDKKDEEFALSLGAERFIVKPMEPKRFMEIIEGILKDYKKGLLAPSEIPEEEETVYLKEYNERLIKKIEDKMLQLEIVNKVLGRSETKYRELIDNANDAIIIIEPTGCLSFVNPKFCEMTGYSMEEVENLYFTKLVHSEDLPMVTENFERMPAGGVFPKNYEFRVLTKAGEVLYAELNATPIEREEKTVGIQAIVRDISERKQAEEALRESEEKFRSLFESATEFIHILDKTGRIIQTNPATTRQSGYSEGELVGRRLDELLTPASQKIFEKGFPEILARGANRQEVEFVCKDGTIIIMDCSASVIRDERGDVKAIVAFQRDVTERKRAEEALERLNMDLDEKVKVATQELSQEKEKLDIILHNTADGILVTDSKNRVLMANPAAEYLLGFNLKEAPGKKLDMSIRDKTLKEKIYRTREEERVGYEFELEIKDPITSEPRVLSGKTACLKNRDGEVMGVVTALNDITRLREVDRMKTEFLSTAAHELRTPLTSIQGFSEILLTRDTLSEEERKKFLSYINKQAVSLAGIVSDLLDISRIESRLGFTLNIVKCNASEAIKDIIPYFKDMSSKHKFEVVLPDERVELFVDKEKMGQALKNILSNAVKYSPEGGIIRVIGEAYEDYYQVSVEDQGIGMTPEQIEKIFDKFYRANTTNSAPEGTGLGMTIVKYIVEAHGGKVWVESEYGKGTTVRFTIPFGS